MFEQGTVLSELEKSKKTGQLERKQMLKEHSSYVMLCCVMLYVMLCYTILCYVSLLEGWKNGSVNLCDNWI